MYDWLACHQLACEFGMHGNNQLSNIAHWSIASLHPVMDTRNNGNVHVIVCPQLLACDSVHAIA